MNQLIYRLAAFHKGYIVHLGLEEGEYTAASLLQAWRGEFGLKEDILEKRVVHVFGRADNSVQRQQQLAETGLTLAEGFRRQGHEALLVVDSRLALVEGVAPYLRAYGVATPEAAVTTLYHGDFTVGLEPAPLANLDAVITFDRERAMQRLYPAVDPLRSYSRLLQPELVGQNHVAVVSQARRFLQRYRELHYEVEKNGLDSLFHLDQRQEDELIVRRARRLNRFLTQPFFGTEPWTGLPGQYVTLEAALAGCQAILAGQTDEWPEEALYFGGTLEQAARNNGS
jgi:F-type H+-transporting ATPase subunit beta